MPEPDISPLPDSPEPQGGSHYRAEDDIELPPMPTGMPGSQPPRNESGKKSTGFGSVLGVAALIGAIVIGGWYMMGSGSAERQHPNWQHVTAATQASSDGTNYVIHLDEAGNTLAVPSISISAKDADRSTSEQVRAALLKGDLAAATTALQSAQDISSTPQADTQQSEIAANSDLESAIKEGRKEFFEVYLFDCCQEDGDVVEILVNEKLFATIPITHEGMSLSIPLARGSNTLTLRGVKDGGGGVTVSLRTSQGDYFCRSMRVGEEHRMGVVVQ